MPAKKKPTEAKETSALSTTTNSNGKEINTEKVKEIRVGVIQKGQKIKSITRLQSKERKYEVQIELETGEWIVKTVFVGKDGLVRIEGNERLRFTYGDDVVTADTCITVVIDGEARIISRIITG